MIKLKAWIVFALAAGLLLQSCAPKPTETPFEIALLPVIDAVAHLCRPTRRVV